MSSPYDGALSGVIPLYEDPIWTRAAAPAPAPAGSTCTVPPSWAWARPSVAARNDEVPPPPLPGGMLRFSFGRIDIARYLTTSAIATSATANP
jgi:hypothetical protein